MKLQILSDLHLEQGIPSYLKDFKPVGDVLILAGDITNAKNFGQIEKVFGNVKIPVLYTPGNHEYYGGDFKTTLTSLEAFFHGHEYIKVMDCDHTTIDGVMFHLATYWSHVSVSDELEARRCIADFNPRVVVNCEIQDQRNRNWYARQWLKSSMAKGRELGVKKNVVVTHFPPSWQAQEARFRSSGLGSYFYNKDDDLVELLEPDLWVYGHTHGDLRFQIGKTPVVTNQQGYLRKGDRGIIAEPCFNNFDVNYVVEV